MLTVENLSKSYGNQLLFAGASFMIGSQARIGVMGPNGAGKSTFFRMLAGEEESNTGRITKPKQYRLAVLRQEWVPESGDSILEAALRGHQQWYEARARLREIEHQLEISPNNAALLAEYQNVEHEYAVVGGYTLEQQAQEYLTGLGFKPAQFTQPCTELSGGWRMRVHLAGLLLQEPDLLLLDEPTNHLDVESVVWFENFLSNYPHAILLISHDRRLIERFASEVLEFAPPTLTLWPGGLRQFETQKIARIQQLEAEIANREREIEHLQVFINRFKAKASKASQAQSRMKTAEKHYEEIAELRAKMPLISKRPSRFNLVPWGRQPRVFLEIDHASVGYSADKPLFSVDRCVIESGKKIGVIGVNGVGKSTFLKLCAGELQPLSGKVKRNEDITIGYFAQHRMEELPLDFKGFDYLSEKTRGNSVSEIRGVAASLGLTANDLDKRIEVLSGGEKARLSLSRILLSRPGVLLLDEPTNHLDMEACDALVNGLKHYSGTVLVVSHDRDFLDSLATMILEVQPGKAILHHGNYADWLEQHQPAVSMKGSSSNQKPVVVSGPRKTKEQKRQEAQERQRQQDASKSVKQEISRLEKEVQRLNEACKALDLFLCDPLAPKHAEFSAKLKERSRLATELEKVEAQWLRLAEQNDPS